MRGKPPSWPRAALEVARRDLLVYLRSPIALVVAAAFLVLEGVSFAALVSALADPARPAPLGAVLEGHFGGTVVHWALQFIVVAALAARIAEERRTGTWEALVTAPVPDGAAIAGAWLAAVAFYALLWLPTLAYIAVLVHYAPPGASVDVGPLATAYAGEVAIGAAALALALAAGAWSAQPLVATVAGFAALVVWLVLGELPGLAPDLAAAHPDVAAVLDRGGPRAALSALARGEVRWDTAVALLALTAGGLRIAAAVAAVGRRRRGTTPAAVAEGVLVAIALGLCAVLVGRAAAPWDVTASRRNSLEPATRTVLARVDDPIAITIVRPGIGGLDPVFDEVARVLSRMTTAQPALRVSTWDPAADPSALPQAAAAAALGEEDLLRVGVVILARGPRRRAVSLLDLATIGKDALAAPSVETLRIEAAIAQALAELIDDTPVRVCATRGHGELAIDDGGQGGVPGAIASWSPVVARLRVDGIAVDPIDIAGGVPAACRVVAVIGAATPMSSDEALAIAHFLDGGGRVLIALAGRNLGSTEAPVLARSGLETVLASWDVRTPPAWVVDPPMAIPQLPLAFRVDTRYAEHPVTAGFRGRRVTGWQRARPVVAGKDAVALVTTSDDGWGETTLDAAPSRDDRDVPGPVTLAAAIARGDARLVVLGSAEALSPASAARSDGGDLLAAQAVGWLAGRAAPVEVPAKNPERIRLVMTGAQRRSVAVIVVGAVPLVTAALLWLLGRRRRAR